MREAAPGSLGILVRRHYCIACTLDWGAGSLSVLGCSTPPRASSPSHCPPQPCQVKQLSLSSRKENTEKESEAARYDVAGGGSTEQAS
jgi:hypothetical protein